jgi:hypothetical protein
MPFVLAACYDDIKKVFIDISGAQNEKPLAKVEAKSVAKNSESMKMLS